jgi:NADH-quinone oxidoreductase subunit C
MSDRPPTDPQRPASNTPAASNTTPSPDTTPAAKEEMATDLSEVARARLSGTDKTAPGESTVEDAVDAAGGVAGTPADDDTAAAVEESPTAVIGKSHPGPGASGRTDADDPVPTPPAGPAGAPPPMTATGGGSQTAPLETQPAGTGAPTRPPSPSSAQTPASPAQGAPSGPTTGTTPASAPSPAAGEPSGTPTPSAAVSTGGAATPASATGGPTAPSVGTPDPVEKITGTPPDGTRPAGTVPQANDPATSDKEASTGAGAVVPPAAAGTTGTTPAAPPAVTPAQGATPAQAGVGEKTDPDTTATSPTAPDAPPTAAAAAAATGEAGTRPGALATPARPAGGAPAAGGPAAGDAPATGARPAAARPAGAAGARPAAAGARPAGAGGARPGAAPAAPPAPPEPDPDEVTALRALVPDLTWERRHGYVEVKVPSEQLISVAQKVKELGYDYLSAVTAVDWRDRLEMLYHCYGWDYVDVPGCMVIRADLPPEANPLCPSLTAVWAGADFQEREIYDLFGIKFVGHPDLRRILLEERFPGHPMRKDWTFDYEYVLVKHLKYGAEGQDGPPGGEEGFRRV